jgi:hypothetical protein
MHCSYIFFAITARCWKALLALVTRLDATCLTVVITVTFHNVTHGLPKHVIGRSDQRLLGSLINNGRRGHRTLGSDVTEITASMGVVEFGSRDLY